MFCPLKRVSKSEVQYMTWIFLAEMQNITCGNIDCGNIENLWSYYSQEKKPSDVYHFSLSIELNWKSINPKMMKIIKECGWQKDIYDNLVWLSCKQAKQA